MSGALTADISNISESGVDDHVLYFRGKNIVGNITADAGSEFIFMDFDDNYLRLYDLQTATPTIVLDDYSGETTDTTPSFTGTATAAAGATISSVEYRVDNGSWLEAEAEDGTFDENVENYLFTVSELEVGTHIIESRAKDNSNDYTDSGSYASLEITISAPEQEDEGEEQDTEEEEETNPPATEEDSPEDNGSDNNRTTDNTETSDTANDNLNSNSGTETIANIVAKVASEGFSINSNYPVIYFDLITSPQKTRTIIISGQAKAETGKTISSVEISVDKESWQTAIADDGVFDSQKEAFSHELSFTADGTYTVYGRATDSSAKFTSEANYAKITFEIDTSNSEVTGNQSKQQFISVLGLFNARETDLYTLTIVLTTISALFFLINKIFKIAIKGSLVIRYSFLTLSTAIALLLIISNVNLSSYGLGGGVLLVWLVELIF